MLELFISPGKYVSGYDIIDKLGIETVKLGKKALVIVDKTTEKLGEKGIDALQNVLDKVELVHFRGECSFEEIDRLVEIVKEKNLDCVVGLGGGKLMDTTKAVGYDSGIKIITVPTIAATCASWASHSVIYTPDGINDSYYPIYKNSDLLFFDKKISFEAPARYTISGMVDTLAKWIETKSFISGLKKKNTALESAIFFAKKCYDEILDLGEEAIKDIKEGNYTDRVDKMLEHNIFTAGLVGGIGGEACRAVAAHAMNNGLTAIPRLYFGNLHGEVVGFGNLVQLILDGDVGEAKKIAEFYRKIGAPATLAELGFKNLTEEELEKIINKAMYKGDTMWNLPYEFDFDKIKDAVLKADSLLV
jgi:glycerol dehydrogenase-like iron-containing ADH family enzyme